MRNQKLFSQTVAFSNVAFFASFVGMSQSRKWAHMDNISRTMSVWKKAALRFLEPEEYTVLFTLERGSFLGNSMEHIFGLECEKQGGIGVGDSKGSVLFILERGSFL